MMLASDLPVRSDIDDEIDDYEDLFKTSQFGHLVVNSQILSKTWGQFRFFSRLSEQSGS